MSKTFVFIPVLIMFVILAVLLVYMALPLGQTHKEAVGGVADLREADLGVSIYQLTGQWQVTPGELYMPYAFPDDAGTTVIPEKWAVSDDALNTCATYRLVVYTDDARLLTLLVPEIYTAFDLWVNGEYSCGAGTVSDDPADGRPEFKNVLIPVRAIDGAVEIVIQASNYHYMRPLMNNQLLLGEYDFVYTWFFRSRAIYIMALGFLLAASFYHFTLYVLRRKELVYLLFSLLCFICFCRYSIDNGGIIDHTGWFSIVGGGQINLKILMVLFFLHGMAIAAFSLYIFDREWLMTHRKWAFGYAITGTVLYATIPWNMAIAPVIVFLTVIPVILFSVYRAARSRILREDRMMWHYFIALILYAVVSVVQKIFFDHLLFMTGLIAEMYLIMAQALILGSHYSATMAREQELAAKNAVMEHSARIRTYMIDTLSHEVRTPLTVMSSYAQLAIERINAGNLDDLTLVNLKKISDEAVRLSSLASSALRLSQLSDLPDDGEFSCFDVGELALQIAHLFEPMVKKNGRKLILDLPEVRTSVFGCANSLTRLIWNLLDNALTHSKRGDIELIVSIDGSDVHLTVRDHGVGIPPELLPDIFESGISCRPDGSGLGLGLCRGIACDMKGDITINSELGIGTTVTLILPSVPDNR